MRAEVFVRHERERRGSRQTDRLMDGRPTQAADISGSGVTGGRSLGRGSSGGKELVKPTVKGSDRQCGGGGGFTSLLPLDRLDKGTVTGVLAQVVAFLIPRRVCLLRGEWRRLKGASG